MLLVCVNIVYYNNSAYNNQYVSEWRACKRWNCKTKIICDDLLLSLKMLI